MEPIQLFLTTVVYDIYFRYRLELFKGLNKNLKKYKQDLSCRLNEII